MRSRESLEKENAVLRKKVARLLKSYDEVVLLCKSSERASKELDAARRDVQSMNFDQGI